MIRIYSEVAQKEYVVAGKLKIDCNPNNYSGFLNNAANESQFNMIGSSKMLEALSNISENGNILVKYRM